MSTKYTVFLLERFLFFWNKTIDKIEVDTYEEAVFWKGFYERVYIRSRIGDKVVIDKIIDIS